MISPETDNAILPGKGLLASMMAWVTGTRRQAEHTSEPLPERFDPAAFMRELLAYERRHRSRLYGAGLVLGLADELPPPSMNAVARHRGYSGAADAFSFKASDYAGDGYEDAMRKVFDMLTRSSDTHTDLDHLAPRQAAHLANAICVRAALRMAPYSIGSPRIVLEPSGAARVDFVPPSGSHVPARSVTVSSDSNAMGVSTSVKASLEQICQGAFDLVSGEVVKEFDACIRAGLSKTTAEAARTAEFLRGLPAVVRMSRSLPAFVNLRGIYAANTRFMASLSRPALTDALRHGRWGWTLGAYAAHLDPQVAAEVAAARHLGAVAFAGYSQRTLRVLWEGHTGRRREDQAAANTALGSLSPPQADPSVVSHALLAEFNKHLSQPARTQLGQMSPKYLAQLVIGGGMIAALGEDYALRSDETAKATRAGRRLALALNAAADPALGLKGLPWADVLGSSRARDLLTQDISEEDAARGLRSLIAYANALRAKGRPASNVVSNLPAVEALIAAPAACPVPALERLQGIAGDRAFRAAHRSAAKVLDDLLKKMGPIQSDGFDHGPLKGLIEWEPALVGFEAGTTESEEDLPFDRTDSNRHSALVIAMRDAKTGKHWQRLWLYVFTNPSEDGRYRLRFGVDKHHGYAYLPVVQGARRPGYQPQNLISLPGIGISSPHSVERELPRALAAAQARHAQTLKAVWRERFQDLIRHHPAEMASLLSPLAQFILSGQDSAYRPVASLGSARALRLARASMSLENTMGFELIVSRMRDPRATMASGASVLDVALESRSTDFARAALQVLAKHPVLAGDAAAMRQLVQNSMGKLVERHPDLLPLAVELGATVDSATLAAWDALHPHLKSPEAAAGLTAARMRAAIEAATVHRGEIFQAGAGAPTAANDPPAAPPRRRAGL